VTWAHVTVQFVREFREIKIFNKVGFVEE